MGKQKNLWLHLLRASGIARRYFITNGFDGALTILGMITGFQISGMKEVSVAISACVGASVALFISGLCSAYLSEKAEREKELLEMEQALIVDLKESDYGEASRYLPIFIALVNGLSPLLFSLVILLPLILAQQGILLPFAPFISSIIAALICIFFIGVFLGKISKTFWLWSGFRTLIIALFTVAVILSIGSSL